ncbi:MAG: peptidase S10, partial [Sandarakinorhabdus sp.]|nr:peptidase S10 [Sandarakinorhabdus sp.]
MRRFVSLIAVAAMLAAPALAQSADKPAAEAAIPAPNRVVAKRSGTFGGVRVNYTAIAGETYLS